MKGLDDHVDGLNEAAWERGMRRQAGRFSSADREKNAALADLRRDVIDEVAAALPPGATGQEAVAAIKARLDRGLPRLIAISVQTGRDVSDEDRRDP